MHRPDSAVAQMNHPSSGQNLAQVKPPRFHYHTTLNPGVFEGVMLVAARQPSFLMPESTLGVCARFCPSTVGLLCCVEMMFVLHACMCELCLAQDGGHDHRHEARASRAFASGIGIAAEEDIGINALEAPST